MRKANLVCGFLLLTLLAFPGCSGSGEKYLTPDQIAMQQSNDIMAAIMKNDKGAFKEFLCSGLQEEHPDLDREIEELFAFVDGDIVSFDVDNPAARGGATTEEGWVRQDIATKIKNIQTSSGKSYDIYYRFNTIYEGHPEQLGIIYFVIYISGAKHDPVTGYPPGESYLIEFKKRL